MNSTPRIEPIKVGLIGCGTVGSNLVQLLAQRNSTLESTTGLQLEISQIAVRSLSKNRNLDVDDALFTTDADSLVANPEIDIVVELIGGIEPARSLVLAALKAGKPVVTANKELLANVGSELYQTAETAGVDLLFEAAVAGAIPIVRPLRESLLGEDLHRILGIINGTTNYILTRMTEDGAGYAEALSEAQQQGFAERDPTADVEGFDAGAKAAIMASIAFGVSVVAGDVFHEGISRITQQDIQFAKRSGYVIKAIASAERLDNDEISVRVHPAMLSKDHPLSAVRGSFNAVFVEGRAAGELMFYGRGAGGKPTASAVLGDVIDAAHNLQLDNFSPVPTGPKAKIRPLDELESSFYIGASIDDTSGVLAKVAGVFDTHNVSIKSMEQDDALDGVARVAFITHAAKEASVNATLEGLKELDTVQEIYSVLRVL